MLVLKFGGTSVGSAEAIIQMKTVVQDFLKKEKGVVVVVSAFNGVTDQLIDLGKKASAGGITYLEQFKALEERHLNAAKALLPIQEQSAVLAQVKRTLTELEDLLHGCSLLKELSARSLDLIMSFGERLSAYIIAHSFLGGGTPASFVDARELIQTDAKFGAAWVNFAATNEAIQKYFETEKNLPIVTGFIGKTPAGETTTLGRGGSDYTAAILASALNAKEIQIWKDVDGVMTTDPQIVPEAFVLPSLTYQEAMELSHFGAKVIYPQTMRPAMEKKIPIRIKNTFRPELPGSLIEAQERPHPYAIKGISCLKKVNLLTLEGVGLPGTPGTASRLFSALGKNHINVILISQASSEHSICFAVTTSETKKAKEVVNEEFQHEQKEGLVNEIREEENLAIVAVVGQAMKHKPGVAGKVFTALGENNVNVVAIAQGASELNISAVIPEADLKKALRGIHAAFFASLSS